ncbi:MAG: addiction module protein [Saprospiraceae bacterium]|nr:addiction module protein [Saprospiraceae bacterium]
MSIQAIKEEVYKLSKTEQAELIYYMVELLAMGDFDLSGEWKAELDRREEALDKGSSIGRPAKDVIGKYVSL